MEHENFASQNISGHSNPIDYRKRQKVFVLGIDGAMPEMVFGEWLNELPNIKKVLKDGCYARLNSTDPPLSITAWSSITTGKTPTDTGIFEYIYRKDRSYHDIGVMTSKNLREKQIWEIASEKGIKSIVPYMILTWPLKPFNGCLVAGPQRPNSEDTKCVYPLEMKQELIEKFGEVPGFDIPKFRSSYEIADSIKKEETSKEYIIEQDYLLAERNTRVMEHLIKTKEWDLFFGVIGMTDQMNHMFWKYCDPTHRKYDPESKYLNTLKEFYKFIDEKVGELLNLLEEDTKIILLSDHGIMKLNTRVNVTDWLIKEGYMVLKEKIKEKTPFNFSMVDWSKTKAFAIGAYEAQISLNMKGREPEGIVEEHEYEGLIKEISEKLKKIPGDWGEKLDTTILFKKKDYDGKFVEEAPDMIVYFEGMQYGSNTTLIGNETLWSPSTAKGSDDATHSMQGIFIMDDRKTKTGNLGEISYLDVAPTILNLLELKVPEDMSGKIIGDEIMSKEKAITWIKQVIYNNPGTLNDPLNLMERHLPFSYDIAYETAEKIIKQYPNIISKLDPRKVALAAIMHDVGRPLKSNQVFHEIRGYKYLIANGLNKGLARTQEDVEEIAKMMLPHGPLYEMFIDERYSREKEEFIEFNPEILIPRTLAQAIVDYSDIVNLGGKQVDFRIRIDESIERYKAMNDPSVDHIIKSSERRVKAAEKIVELINGSIPAQQAEDLVKNFRV